MLPGEKVQFIVAGLSTKYRPLLVVSAAGLAFAGWTALEIAFGNALQGVLSPVALDAVTAVLFGAFACVLWRSTPGTDDTDAALTDGGALAPIEDVTVDAEILGVEIPDYTPGHILRNTQISIWGRTRTELPDRTTDGFTKMCPGVYFGRFVRIFAMMAAGEFGDKTQLVTIGLAVTYGATPAIWAGEMLAIIPVSLANAYFFHTFADRFDAKKAHLFSAGLFAFFALDTVLGIVTRLAYGPGGSVTVWETVVEFFADVVLALV